MYPFILRGQGDPIGHLTNPLRDFYPNVCRGELCTALKSEPLYREAYLLTWLELLVLVPSVIALLLGFHCDVLVLSYTHADLLALL